MVSALGEQIDSHRNPAVFCSAHGGYQRRSNFNRRAWTPAATGNPDRGVPPVLAGMHFHDLRHTHKTWLIEDAIPEIAQARRLGHRLSGVRGVYSHVTEPMQQTLVEALQRRWESSHGRAPAADDSRPGTAAA